MRLLALDTSTEACSAALLWDGTVHARYAELERGHAERILPMIDELLVAAGASLAMLDAIAFARGPGAFTGLRLAASVTQGLAFAAGRRVVPVSTLQIVAQGALRLRPDADQIVVCNDARMGELYWAAFQPDARGIALPTSTERVSAPAEVRVAAPHAGQLRVGAGRGFRLAPQLAAQLGLAAAEVLAELLPSAETLLELAALEVQGGNTLDCSQALPVYVRDDVARPRASQI